MGDDTLFKGEKGFITNPNGGRRPWRNAGQGHYYLAMPKLGKVMCASSRSPFKGNNAYNVSPEWITQGLQGGKMTYANAKCEYIKCCRNVAHNLPNLEKICLENRQIHLLARASAVKLELEKGRRPSKSYALVDAWLEEGRACRRRYRFLVIEGPSCVGKTQFVLNRFGHDSCIETNCSSTPEPDLRDFDSTKHRAILFDEAPCSLVLRNKKLFQASASFVQLGCSMTNCHRYEIWAHQTYMVVTSNTWSAELSMLPAQGDKDWLMGEFCAPDGDRSHVLMSTCGTSLSPWTQLVRYFHAQEVGLVQQRVARRATWVGTWNAHALGWDDIARFVIQLLWTAWCRSKNQHSQ